MANDDVRVPHRSRAPVSCSFDPSLMIRTISAARFVVPQQRQIRLLSVMATNEASSPPSAEYKQLGKSGLRVSVPILGAMSFGDKRWAPWIIEEDQVVAQTLQRCQISS